MATKKKAAKPAKKTIAPKKAAPAKKPAAKPAGKVSKPAPKAAVKTAKPAPKPAKPNGGKVVVPEKKPVAKVVVATKPAVKAPIKPDLKPLAKNPVPEPVKVEKKPEVPKVEVKKPEPAPPPPPLPKKPAVPAKPVKVIIPEIKTKTVRKYEPEFTKSVLDQPENIQTGPTMRYSDSELGEFRELIQKKLEQAKKELSYLQGLITRKDEMGGDETENRYMTMEDGSMSMEREQLAQMASRQINYIDHLEKAMMRIENKTYGICRVTGKLIDKARLKAVPHATLSIEAKQMMNK
jgi:RNA polymerase-binding transcription factor DksA